MLINFNSKIIYLLSISIGLILIQPFMNGFFCWMIEPVLKLAMGTSPELHQISLLAGKSQTFFFLLTLFLLFQLWKKEVIFFVNRFFSSEQRLFAIFAYTFLSIPLITFFSVGARTYQIDNWFLLVSGLFCALFLEVLIISAVINSLMILPRFKKEIVFLVLSVYELSVFAMAALVYSSAEMDYLKYLEMIWGADLSYLLSNQVLLPLVLFLAAIGFIVFHRKTSIFAKMFYSEKNLGINSLLILLFFLMHPIQYLGGIYALPSLSLTTSLAKVEAGNLDKVVGGHVPKLISNIFRSQEGFLIDDFSAEENIFISENGMFLKSNRYDPVQPSFKRVILLTVESLSSVFMGSAHKICKQPVMPFLESMHFNYPSAKIRTNATPTLYGLSAIFSSHPNPKVPLETGFPISFVKSLRQNNFETILIRSAPEKYANEHIYFKQAGFNKIIGSNYFKKIGLEEFVHGWGLEDAFLYDFIAGYLRKKKNDQYFLHVLPADTHTPFGRKVYSKEYSGEIELTNCKIDNQKLLQSFHRQDMDIKRFYNSLIDHEVLDDETVLIITADHSSPKFFKPYPGPLDFVPIVFISRNSIKGLELNSKNISQVDIAPTVLELTGIQSEPGFFGTSLFTPGDRKYLGVHDGIAYVSKNKGIQTFDLLSANDKDIQTLSGILNSVLVQKTD